MENAPTLDVLLVEDNDVFRDALELMLGVVPDVRVVGAVADGRTAVSAAVDLQPDVVLLDYRLPELDGVEATAAIRASSHAAVVVLTASVDPAEAGALLEAGAVACLTKDTDLDGIVGALRAAARTDGAGATVVGSGGGGTPPLL